MDSENIVTGVITAGVLAVIGTVSRLIHSTVSEPVEIKVYPSFTNAVVAIRNKSHAVVRIASVAIVAGNATTKIPIPEVRGCRQDTLDDGASKEFVLSDYRTSYTKVFDVPCFLLVTLQDGRRIRSQTIILREIVNQTSTAWK